MSSVKKEMNVLLTTLGSTKDYLNIKYFCYKDEQGRSSFCTGISNAEAGTKYMLSNYKIDRILVLGPENESMTDKVIELKNTFVPAIVDKDSADELDFYCYRIAQFLNNVDIETNDILFECDLERKDEIDKKLKKTLEKSRDGYFYLLENDASALAQYKRFMSDYSSKDEEIEKHVLYTEMDSFFKMRSLICNEDVTVKYIGVSKLENGEFSSVDLFDTVRHLTNPNEHINLYMDLQGIDKGDSIAIWNILQMYGSMNYGISLCAMICTQNRNHHFTNSIFDENARYNTELLLSAIRSFIYYGKTDQFYDYCEKNNLRCKLISAVLKSMKYVETGISLNNVNDLTYGMELLRMIIHGAPETDMTSHERFVYVLLQTVFTKDYGRLLTTPELDIPELISWALRKGFYQQALTLTESLVPADLVKKGIYYYARTDEELSEIKEQFNVKYWCENQKNRYIFEDIDHMFIKNYGRDVLGYVKLDDYPKAFAKLKMRMLHECVGECKQAFSNLGNEDMLYELLMNYYSVSSLRNKVSHAAGTARNLTSIDNIEESNTLNQVESALRMFLGLYISCSKRVAALSDAPAPLRMSPEEFKSYAKRHKLSRFDAGSDQDVIENNVECSFNGKEVRITIKMLDIEDDPEE